MGAGNAAVVGVQPALSPGVSVVLVDHDVDVLSSGQCRVATVCDGVVARTETVEDTCGDVEDLVCSTRSVTVVVVSCSQCLNDQA